MFIASLCAVGVIVPRFAGSAQRKVVFWKGIVSFGSSSAYARGFRQLSAPEMTGALLEHCYELAAICVRKYRLLRVSIVAGAVGLVAALMYLLLK